MTWRAFVRSGRLGSGYLVLRVDTRENLVGKNGVMTVAPSLFGVSWHKERWTKNKCLDFCPLGFSWLPYPSTVAVQFISVHVPVLSGSERTFQGLRRIGRGARRRLVARKVTLARGRGLAPRDSSALFRPFSSLDPTLPILALLLISCYPGLRLTNRFCLRALRVSKIGRAHV